MKRFVKLVLAISITTSTSVLGSTAYAWKLENMDSYYKVTCNDGWTGGFESYPNETALKKVCGSHGGVADIEQTTGALATETEATLAEKTPIQLLESTAQSRGSGIHKKWLMEQEIKKLDGIVHIKGASGGCGVWDDPNTPGQGCVRDNPVRLPSH